MNFKDHLTAGVITGASCGGIAHYIAQDPKMSAGAFLLGVFGGLFPDLDTKSTPTKWFARFSSVSFLFGLWQVLEKGNFIAMAFVPSLVLSLAQSGKHRGWTHSYFFPFVVCGSGAFIHSYMPLFISFALGILSHYALYSMNPLEGKNWI